MSDARLTLDEVVAIDSHVHVFLTEVNIRHLEAIPLTLLTAKSAELMKGMIDRGFTTVRDTGGAVSRPPGGAGPGSGAGA